MGAADLLTRYRLATSGGAPSRSHIGTDAILRARERTRAWTRLRRIGKPTQFALAWVDPPMVGTAAVATRTRASGWSMEGGATGEMRIVSVASLSHSRIHGATGRVPILGRAIESRPEEQRELRQRRLLPYPAEASWGTSDGRGCGSRSKRRAASWEIFPKAPNLIHGVPDASAGGNIAN